MMCKRVISSVYEDTSHLTQTYLSDIFRVIVILIVLQVSHSHVRISDGLHFEYAVLSSNLIKGQIQTIEHHRDFQRRKLSRNIRKVHDIY